LETSRGRRLSDREKEFINWASPQSSIPRARQFFSRAVTNWGFVFVIVELGLGVAFAVGNDRNEPAMRRES